LLAKLDTPLRRGIQEELERREIFMRDKLAREQGCEMDEVDMSGVNLRDAEFAQRIAGVATRYTATVTCVVEAIERQAGALKALM
jgi:hypothetical protein